jgi:putative addiction module component (TIGR02574 family)
MQMLNTDEIARLSPEERIVLIGHLWDSLQDADVPLPAAQKVELARRLSSLDQDRAQAVTWEQLRAELARRCPLAMQVAFTPAARVELLDAQDWYESQRAGLGTRFREEVGATVIRMAENPQQFSGCP